MGNATAATTARTITMSRRGFSLGLGALLLGTIGVPSVDASKNTGKKAKRIAERVRNVRDLCEAGGGTTTVSERRGGTTVTCNGGANDGYTCTISSKNTRCFQTLTKSPATKAGGGAGVPPSDGADDGGGGGGNAGGGAGVPPGGGAEDPGNPPTGGPVLE